MGLFERFDDADVQALVEAYPLAWVCAGAPGAIEASLLPLVGLFDAEGRLTELVGHLMRSNPLCPALQAGGGATILFKGPDAYVSPEHAGVRDWGPTWNYAQIKVGADVLVDEALTEWSLQLLIDAMESGRVNPWGIEELGVRYQGMLQRIIGFQAKVTSLSGKFKLGQDENPETRASILASLPDPDTVAWMRRFNEGRGDEEK